jgi:hypothetical protein
MHGSFGRFESETTIAGYRFLPADRNACPVCGHPTGDCTTEGAKPTHIWGQGSIERLENEEMFYVEHDVIEERQITPFSKSRVLVAAAGKSIPIAEAKRLGLFPS